MHGVQIFISAVASGAAVLATMFYTTRWIMRHVVADDVKPLIEDLSAKVHHSAKDAKVAAKKAASAAADAKIAAVDAKIAAEKITVLLTDSKE